MNKYKIKHEERKGKILNLLRENKAFYEKYNKVHYSEVFDTLIKDLENEEFSIVLVGEFSAGKSTFLNALMGEKILPSFTDETTATVNFLRHKDKAVNGEEGKVFFNNGEIKTLDKVDFETINKYVCTKSEIGVANSIEHLDIYLDSKFLEGNVTLVDSPGLNGTADGHREITEAQIEKSSASIFMFKADQPGSKTDFEFLRQLKNRVNTIIFVLNKIDDIKVSEGETPESVIESLKKNYKKHFEDESTIPEIWGVSAYQALVARSNKNLDYHDRNDFTEEEKCILEEKSRMAEFENRLWKFLTQGEKARSILVSPIEKIIKISKEVKDDAENKIAMISNASDTNEVEEQIIDVKNSIEKITLSIKDQTKGISDKFDILVREIEESFDAKAIKLKESEVRKLEHWDDIDELIDFEKNLVSKSNREFVKILNRCEKEFENGIKNIIEEDYEELALELNENLGCDKINISINTKYEPTEVDFKLGIETYEKEISSLENQLKEKEAEIDNIESNRIKVRVATREKERLEEKISQVKGEKRSYESILAPSKEFRTETVNKEHWNTSIFGSIKDVFFGRKIISETNTVVSNQEEIAEFKKQKDKRTAEYRAEISKLESQMDNIDTDGMQIEELEYLRKKIITQEAKLQAEIQEKQNEFKEQYIKKNKKALVARKVEIEEYLENVTDEYIAEISKHLMREGKKYSKIIKDTISNSLNSRLEDKKSEFNLLEAKLKSSQNEKEKFIEELKSLVDESNELTKSAVSIQVELESEEINVINEEVI